MQGLDLFDVQKVRDWNRRGNLSPTGPQVFVSLAAGTERRENAWGSQDQRIAIWEQNQFFWSDYWLNWIDQVII